MSSADDTSAQGSSGKSRWSRQRFRRKVDAHDFQSGSSDSENETSNNSKRARREEESGDEVNLDQTSYDIRVIHSSSSISSPESNTGTENLDDEDEGRVGDQQEQQCNVDQGDPHLNVPPPNQPLQPDGIQQDAQDSSDEESGNDSVSSESSESDSEGSESPDDDDDIVERGGGREDDDREGGGGDDDGNPPLYPGAPIGILDSVLAIMAFAFAHSLTGICIADLLLLIALHCPVDSICVRSMYKLKKFFANMGREVLVRHFYCSNCLGILDGKDSICDKCGDCEKSFFLEVPLFNQLQNMFSRPGFYNDLQYRFNRAKKNPNNIEDIYDGRIYKTHAERGFLNKQANISLMWYSDGIPVYKSSKFSIWPLYFVISELSYKNRVKRQNIILAGMWFGDSKPQANTF